MYICAYNYTHVHLNLTHQSNPRANTKHTPHTHVQIKHTNTYVFTHGGTYSYVNTQIHTSTDTHTTQTCTNKTHICAHTHRGEFIELKYVRYYVCINRATCFSLFTQLWIIMLSRSRYCISEIIYMRKCLKYTRKIMYIGKDLP